MQTSSSTDNNHKPSECSATRKRAIQQRLDTIARKIQELDIIIREEFPEGYVYFEPESGVHAMKRAHKNLRDIDAARIAESTPYCRFDAGGW